jgi:hypothetical protein
MDDHIVVIDYSNDIKKYLTLLMNLYRIRMKCYICQNGPICNTQTHMWIDTRTHLKIVLSFMDSKQNHLMWVFMIRISHLQNKSTNFGKNLNPKQMNNQPIHSHGYENFKTFVSINFSNES